MHFLTIHYTLCVARWAEMEKQIVSENLILIFFLHHYQNVGLVVFIFKQIPGQTKTLQSIWHTCFPLACCSAGLVFHHFLPPVICWCLNELLTSQRMYSTLNTIYLLLFGISQIPTAESDQYYCSRHRMDFWQGRVINKYGVSAW